MNAWRRCLAAVFLLLGSPGPADSRPGRVTDTWRQFMMFQIARTRQLYAESWPGVELLERDGRLAIGAASVFYQGILD